MASKKFFYVFCVLIIVMIFGTAALCNMCGTGAAAATTKTGTEEETAAGSSDGSAGGTTDKGGAKDSSSESTDKTSGSESSSSSESTAGDSTAPTIKLEIYEGPTYSAADDICFYRVKATVTGKPDPTIKFSKDDSSGAWGSKKVQINIHRGQPYTLTANAKNSAGEASASINLSWGCGEENRDPVINDISLSSASIKTGQQYDVTANASDPDGDALTFKWTASGGTINLDMKNPMKWTAPAAVGPATITLKLTDDNGGEATQTKTVNVESAIISAAADLSVNAGNSGYIIVDWGAFVNPYSLFVGDFTNNKQIKAYLTFDINAISNLDNVTIKNTSVSMPVDAIIAHPELMPEVHVRVFDYGSTLEIADQGSGGEFVKIFPATNPMANFDFSSPELIAQLQAAVNANSQRFQLKFSLSGINTDGIGDWYRFVLGDIRMHVEYETPG